MDSARILVVDDEPGLLHTVGRILSPRYAVSCCATPEEARQRARDERPDLAVLDVRMPGCDGFELAAELRELCPGLDVIYMTGVVDEVDAQLVRSIRERAFYFIQKPFDRSVLLTLVERCLELRSLSDQNRRYVELLESELQSARAFQQGMLPARSAVVEGVQVDARYDTCDDLGGDFFDYHAAGPGRAAFLLADVSGHGVRAALLVGVLKAAFHAAAEDDFEPASVVRRIASGLASFDDATFVSVFCGRVDTRAGRLEYVNAGHPAAWLLRADGGHEKLALTGLVISPALQDEPREQRRCAFAGGDALVVCTDGVLEARGEAGQYGRERLDALLEASTARGAALLAEVVADVTRHRGGRPVDDDVSLLTVRRS